MAGAFTRTCILKIDENHVLAMTCYGIQQNRVSQNHLKNFMKSRFFKNIFCCCCRTSQHLNTCKVIYSILFGKCFSQRRLKVLSEKNMKNDEIFQISQLRLKKNFGKKSPLFSKLTKIIKNVSQDVIKPYKCVFTLF